MNTLTTILSCFLLTLGLGSLALGDHGGSAVEHGGSKVEKTGKKHKCKKGQVQKKDEETGKMKCVPKKKKTANMKLPLDRKISISEIKTTLRKYISQNTDSKNIFQYTDNDRSGQRLDLKFVKIHDPVRHMKKKGQYFACTDFAVLGKDGQLHDLDFWMEPTTTGLKIVRTKVHKDPKKQSDKWVKVPRYTFSGEKIIAITQ